VSDTRVDLISAVVALVLLGAVVGFALLQRQGGAPPRGPAEPFGRAAGKETYRAECASCHATAAALAPVFGSEGGRRYLIGLLLRGEIRSVKDGKVTFEEGHPSFDHLTDERIAAVINHIAAGGDVGTTFPENAVPITPDEVRAGRAPPR
jgi:mono/diheme cytochrome c family protein